MNPQRRPVGLLVIAANSRSLIANRADLIKEIRDAGIHVEAVVPRQDYLPETSNLGIPIHQINMTRTSTNPLADLGYLLRLFRIMRKLKPQRVFGYTSKPVIYGSLAARLARVPQRSSMITGLGHIYTSESAKIRLVRRIMNLLYRAGLSSSHTVFFQNPDDLTLFTEQGILRHPERAVRVNGSGVNTLHFTAEPLPQGSPLFLFIGRLLTEKGITEFVEAARQVNKEYPDARFVAVGGHDPSLPHSVPTEQLERWKAEQTVEFVGNVKDVRPWLMDASVFVLPSYREGTPRSALEAMSTARPVITTDAPGCRETVTPGENGFLVPPEAVEPLATAMEQYLESPQLLIEHGAESRRLAEEKYDVRKVNRVIKEAMGV